MGALSGKELATKFANAIQDAMNKVADENGASLNSALGALVGVQGFLIAGLPDRKHRRMMIAEVVKALPQQVAAQLQRGETAETATIKIKGGIN